MSDVIIAIVPAEGHEGLTADGPMGERPALLCRFGPASAWGPFDTDFAGAAAAAGADFSEREWQWALVLHAPGDPKLGMVRAMDAAFGIDATDRAFAVGSSEVRIVDVQNGYPVKRYKNAHLPALKHVPHQAKVANALAHLLLQRGIAREVLVLP